MHKKTVKDIEVGGKRVLVRVDFNVPLDREGNVTDDTRIRASLPTIGYLVDKGAKVILASHLGRPKGTFNVKYSLKPVARRLETLLGKKVTLAEEAVGEIPRRAVEQLGEGEVLLLENVRFYTEEEKNEEKFARALADLADIFVNDAFGAAHRAHASTEGVARFIPGVAGFLMEKEIDMLGRALTSPARPFVAIIGGAKVSDKIGVIGNLLDKVDTLIIGGGMANTFLSARGLNMGKSLVEGDKTGLARELIEKASDSGVELLLPVDLVVSMAADPGAERKSVSVEEVPPDWMALDIGPESARMFGEAVGRAKTVIWNGPMGVFEMEPFAAGTFSVAKAIAGSFAVTIVGGGDSAAAVEKAGVAGQITHISTGGGASLEFLEGKALPGVEALQDK
ncbi:MAG: phosphoglycerate kinase [Peptococcaceae bacterium BICA1-7]|nr:MAG: phosphoglycerate kinase [Peptococcaceae bacterium BICA1-7]HBV99089.1 phosphoglycerate kinase [Desulfotomaculum sp.]